MKKRIATLLALLACSGEPRQVRIDIVVRSSCGVSPQTYDTSCVAGLDVRLVDAAGEVVASQCNDVLNRYPSMSDLVSSRTVLPVLEDVKSEDPVRVEIRGLSAINKAACQDLGEADFMLWGSSEPVDLTAGGVLEVRVDVECRPECDCEDLTTNPLDCPALLVGGACAPLAMFNCRNRQCDTDADCYDGRLTCVGNACQPTATELCSDCMGAAGCAAGLMCVRNRTTMERFCTDRCPPPADSQPCSSRMSCKRLGNGMFELVP